MSEMTGPLAEKMFAAWEKDASVRMSALFEPICTPDEVATEIILSVPRPIALLADVPRAELWLSRAEEASWDLPHTLKHVREALETIDLVAMHMAIAKEARVEVEIVAIELVAKTCATAWARFSVMNGHLAALARGCVDFGRNAMAEMGQAHRFQSAIAAPPDTGSGDFGALAEELAQNWLAAWWEDASPRLPSLEGRCIQEFSPLSE